MPPLRRKPYDGTIGRSCQASGQETALTESKAKTLERREAIGPLIGHLESDHRMGRCHLSGCPAIRCVPCCAQRSTRTWRASSICSTLKQLVIIGLQPIPHENEGAQ
jgi:hypothetical protein